MPTDIICEDGSLESIPVSAELMEEEMLVDDVSAESVEKAPVSVTELRDVDDEDGDVDMRGTRASAGRKKARSMSMVVSADSDEECRSVLMQLEASDGEASYPFMLGRLRDLFFSSDCRQEMQIIRFPSTVAGRYPHRLLQDSFLGLPRLPVPWALPAS